MIHGALFDWKLVVFRYYRFIGNGMRAVMMVVACGRCNERTNEQWWWCCCTRLCLWSRKLWRNCCLRCKCNVQCSVRQSYHYPIQSSLLTGYSSSIYAVCAATQSIFASRRIHWHPPAMHEWSLTVVFVVDSQRWTLHRFVSCGTCFWDIHFWMFQKRIKSTTTTTTKSQPPQAGRGVHEHGWCCHCL